MKSLSLILSVLSFSAFGVTTFQPGQYVIDPAHTRVGFEIGHFVFSKVQGRFNEVKGSFNITKDLKTCELNVEIPVASIDTAVAKRDEHLKSPDFFDAKKFPKISFKSKKCEGTFEDFKIIGDLTIKDVTKEVALETEYEGGSKDPWGNERVAFSSELKIKRQDYNIKFNELMELGPQVGNEVEIDIISELTKQAAKK